MTKKFVLMTEIVEIYVCPSIRFRIPLSITFTTLAPSMEQLPGQIKWPVDPLLANTLIFHHQLTNPRKRIFLLRGSIRPYHNSLKMCVNNSLLIDHGTCGTSRREDSRITAPILWNAKRPVQIGVLG